MTTEIAVWIEQFHFLRPWWLLAILPALVLIAALWQRHNRAGQWQDAIAPHLLRYLVDNEETRNKRWPLLGISALWCLAAIALAGPAWQKLPEPVQKGGSAVVVLWDMSPSMLAQDLQPSRLVRSKLKLIDLLKSRREGTTGLIAYAGEAHVVTPLTDDTQTIISLLPALTPAAMPNAGSNPEMALRMAYTLLQDAGVANGHVLILTDGVVPDAFSALATIQQRAEHQITIWGVGTNQGAPIPLPEGGFAKTSAGEIVIAKLNENELQDLAAEINAYYVPFLQSNEDIETLHTLLSSQSGTMRESDRVFDTWYEHGPWLLLLILPFAALAFRKGWVMCLPLVFIPMAMPQQAHAFSWEDLWQTPAQQAQEAMNEDEPAKAAELFEDPSWQGTARYRAGDFEGALDAFNQGGSARDTYNKGNALMQLQDYEAAMEAYQAALEKDPDNADAKANLDLAQQLLEQKKQQQQKQKGQNQDGENDDQENEQQDQQQGDQREKSESSDDQSSKNSEGNQQKQNGESQQPSEQQDQPYDDPSNNDAEQQSEEPKDEESKAMNEADEESKPSDEKEETPAQQKPATEDGDENPEEQAAPSTRMTQAEREQQQALEQWLRQVPDDPSGLLRNKFQYESRNRRRTGEWQFQDNDAGQRW